MKKVGLPLVLAAAAALLNGNTGVAAEEGVAPPAVEQVFSVDEEGTLHCDDDLATEFSDCAPNVLCNCIC